MEYPSTKKHGQEGPAVARFEWSPRSAEPLEPGPELDREIERRVFGRSSVRATPPFSTEDWSAQTLAEIVSRETGWRFEVSERDGTWSAMWIEPPAAAATKSRRILSLITATGETRAAAICRALLRATRCPRWPSTCREAAAAPGAGTGSLLLSTAS
jgi:hypothetical protein